jgi:hypothetical protein
MGRAPCLLCASSPAISLLSPARHRIASDFATRLSSITGSDTGHPSETRVANFGVRGQQSGCFLFRRLQELNGSSAPLAMQNGPAYRLERYWSAGLEEDACEIVLEGADRETPKEKPVPPGPISYARRVPRHRALQREVLIAYPIDVFVDDPTSSSV